MYAVRLYTRSAKWIAIQIIAQPAIFYQRGTYSSECYGGGVLLPDDFPLLAGLLTAIVSGMVISH